MAANVRGRYRRRVAVFAMAIALTSCGQVDEEGSIPGSTFEAGGPTRIVVDGDRLLAISDVKTAVAVAELAPEGQKERLREPIKGEIQSLGAVATPGESRLDVLVNHCLTSLTTDTDGDRYCEGEVALTRLTFDTKRWKITRTAELAHLGVQWGADLRGGVLDGVPMIRSVGGGGFLLRPDSEVALPDACPVGSILYAAGMAPIGATSYGADVKPQSDEPQVVRRYGADGGDLDAITAPAVGPDEVATGLTVSCSSDALYLERSIANPTQGTSRFQWDVLDGEGWRTVLMASVGSFVPNEYTDPSVVVKVRGEPGDNSAVELVALEGGRTTGKVASDDSRFSSYRVIRLGDRRIGLVGAAEDSTFRFEEAP